MTSEESENKAEFIVEQQAQLAARLGQLVDTVIRWAQGTLERFEATARRIYGVEERISALVDSQMHTEQIVKETTANIRRLTAVVDRYFSEGRNGESGS